MAHSPRGWTGARTPSALKRVRQAESRRAINQPRRSAAKTLIAKAVAASANGASPEEVREAVASAVSALDRAAKTGAIHRKSADRRKSRLMLKVNAALAGAELVSATKSARSTGKAAAAKQAKARIAAGRAQKAKGAQTAAGKARAALARSTREASAPSGEPSATPETPDTQAAEKPAASKTRGGTARSSSRAGTARSSTRAGTARTGSRAGTGEAGTSAEAAKPRSSRTTKKS